MKKKILSVILGLSMLLSASVTAFATGNEVAEAEGIVSYDNLTSVVNLTAGVPTQLYTNSDYTLFSYELSVKNLSYSPGAVDVEVVTETNALLGQYEDVAPDEDVVITIPGGLFGGTDGYSVFVNATVSGQYYFTISGAGVDNPDSDVSYSFFDNQQPGVYQHITSVTMPFLGTGITVTNSAHSPGALTIRVLDYSGKIVGEERELGLGISGYFTQDSSGSILIVEAQAEGLGTYTVTTEVERLFGE